MSNIYHQYQYWQHFPVTSLRYISELNTKIWRDSNIKLIDFMDWSNYILTPCLPLRLKGNISISCSIPNIPLYGWCSVDQDAIWFYLCAPVYAIAGSDCGIVANTLRQGYMIPCHLCWMSHSKYVLGSSKFLFYCGMNLLHPTASTIMWTVTK